MKCKYENKNGTCGLKRSYAYRHKCYTEDLCKCFEPLSNADRIRSMSDEELAAWILKNVDCDKENVMCVPSLYVGNGKWCDGSCRNGRLNLLRKPAEEVHDGQTI